MEKIIEEKLGRKVSDGGVFHFTVPVEAVYLISITARAKSWRQNIRRLFNDDDLAIQIDGVPFYEYLGKKKEFASAGSWNGNQLKNTQKTNWYLLPFASGSHTMTFVADGSPLVEAISVFIIGDTKKEIIFDANLLPKSEKDRLFFDILIKNIEVQSLKISADAGSADIQCAIDGTITEDPAAKRYRRWFWRNNEKTLRTEFAPGSYAHSITLAGRGSPKLTQISVLTNGYRLVQRGAVALHQDIEITSHANVHAAPISTSIVLRTLADKEKIEVLQTRVVGEMIGGKSNIWHEIQTQNGPGYILSSFVEIEGQERGIIVQKIEKKAKEIGVDPELMLLLAGVESRYKPYARSSVAKGIFQLLPDAISDVKRAENFEVTDPYDADQSIEGGIRYAHWLQKHWYHPPVKDWKMKLFLAYNQGAPQVPPDKNIDLSRIKAGRRKEAASHLEYYRKNTKNFNWRNIIHSLLIVILVSSVGLSMRDDKSTLEVVIESSAPLAHIVVAMDERPRIVFEQETGLVTVYDAKNNPVVVLPEKAIHLGRMLPSRQSDGSEGRLSINEEYFFEFPANTFYFFAANSGYCGSAGCWGGLFQIKRGEDIPRLVTESSEIIKFAPSPSGAHMALVGQSRIEETLFIFNTESFSIQEVPFNIGNADCAYIGSLLWKSDLELEIVSNEVNCNTQTLDRGSTKVLRYHLDTKVITTISKTPYLSN